MTTLTHAAMAVLTSAVWAMPLPQTAGARDAAPDARTVELASKIVATLEGTERWAVAAGFPRNYVIAEIAKAVLVAVDAAQVPGPIEAAALADVAAGNLSGQARAAINIVQRETADD